MEPIKENRSEKLGWSRILELVETKTSSHETNMPNMHTKWRKELQLSNDQRDLLFAQKEERLKEVEDRWMNMAALPRLNHASQGFTSNENWTRWYFLWLRCSRCCRRHPRETPRRWWSITRSKFCNFSKCGKSSVGALGAVFSFGAAPQEFPNVVSFLSLAQELLDLERALHARRRWRCDAFYGRRSSVVLS